MKTCLVSKETTDRQRGFLSTHTVVRVSVRVAVVAEMEVMWMLWVSYISCCWCCWRHCWCHPSAAAAGFRSELLPPAPTATSRGDVRPSHIRERPLPSGSTQNLMLEPSKTIEVAPAYKASSDEDSGKSDLYTPVETGKKNPKPRKKRADVVGWTTAPRPPQLNSEVSVLIEALANIEGDTAQNNFWIFIEAVKSAPLKIADIRTTKLLQNILQNCRDGELEAAANDFCLMLSLVQLAIWVEK
jgi:hypothetical protein